MTEKTLRRYKYQFEMMLNSGLNIKEYIKKECKTKHDISKTKNGIIHSSMSDNEKEKYIQLCEDEKKHKPKYHKKKEEPFQLKKTLNKINLIKSKRLKLSYRFQLISGLRVEEISNLTLEDISIKNNKTYVFVKKGKGNKSRKVECLNDSYVVNNLMNLKQKKDGKIFCSTDYLMKKAKEINFHTHDLRKAYAQSIFYNDYSDNKTAIKNLQDSLGHAHNTSTYKKYLSREINLVGTKLDLNKNK